MFGFPMETKLRLQEANANSLKRSPVSMPTLKNLFLEEGKGKNLVYSPLSIYVALGLLSFGAQGKTLEQLLRFLKSQNLEDLNRFCSKIINSLNGNSKGLELSCVNSVWVEKSCVLNPQFKEVANSVFKAEAEAVDFKSKANEVRLMVNQWVETETKGLIKDLIPENKIKSETKIVLVNALYFKGLWYPGQFDKSLTKDSEFYLLDGHSSVQVPFMTSAYYRKQLISCYDGFKVLELMYKSQAQCSQRISMYIILPDRRDGLGELIEMASTDSASFFNQYISVKPPSVPTRQFKVPKFKITFDFEAQEVLKELGLVLPFDSAAELNGMMNASVSVTSVIHKCFVEVDEEGTEAAAATAVMGASFCREPPRPPRPVDFVADHPFIFMIKDNNTGVLLFAGCVLNPLLNS